MKYKWPLMRNAIDFKDIAKLIWFLLTTRMYTQGKKVAEFEEKWSKWLGIKYSVFLSSGSAANLVLISAIKEKFSLKDKDKVLVPMVTWATTVAPVIQLGFTPIFCDVNLDDYSFDERNLRTVAKQHKDIKVVFLTHLLGLPANYHLLRHLFPNAIFIEDACEAHGAGYNDRKVGTLGEGSTFSFYFGHHMTTIEGGIVCTNDKELYEIMKSKRSHGFARELSQDVYKQKQLQYPTIDGRFLFITDGYNFRNTELAAVLGLSQLKKLDKTIEVRRNNYSAMYFRLCKYEKYFIVPKTFSKFNSSFCLQFVCRDKKLKDMLVKKLEENLIETRPIVTGNILKQPFLEKYKIQYKTNADIIHDKGFYVGNNQFVSLKDIRKLEDIIVEVIESYEE